MTRSAEQPRTAAAKRLSTWTMTREAITIGFDAGDGFLGRCRGSDITRFRCAGRCFVTISHPDYIDHVLHEARLKYVKSNDYEPIRASAGIDLLTDEGDSWVAHRVVLSPTFARSQRFTFDLAPDHSVEFESTMTLRPKNGVQVIARSRS